MFDYNARMNQVWSRLKEPYGSCQRFTGLLPNRLEVFKCLRLFTYHQLAIVVSNKHGYFSDSFLKSLAVVCNV